MDSILQIFATTNTTREVKISDGLLLLIGFGGTLFIPLKMVHLGSGEVITTKRYPLTLGKKVEFLEMFADKILVKEENKRLQINNLSTGKITEVRLTKNIPKERILSLSARQMFVGFASVGMVGWNYEGNIILRVETDFNLLNSKLFFSCSQNVAIINHEGSTYGLDLHAGTITQIIHKKKQELKITAVAYDEDRNELFCGDELGGVRVWS